MRVGFSCAVHASDGKNSAVARISARPDGHRGRMAGKPRTRANTGRRSLAAEHQGPKCHLLAAGAFCSRVDQDASRKKGVACPRDELQCPRLRAHLKETSQYYRQRHARRATGIAASVDRALLIRMWSAALKKSETSPSQF